MSNMINKLLYGMVLVAFVGGCKSGSTLSTASESAPKEATPATPTTPSAVPNSSVDCGVRLGEAKVERINQVPWGGQDPLVPLHIAFDKDTDGFILHSHGWEVNNRDNYVRYLEFGFLNPSQGTRKTVHFSERGSTMFSYYSVAEPILKKLMTALDDLELYWPAGPNGKADYARLQDATSCAKIKVGRALEKTLSMTR